MFSKIRVWGGEVAIWLSACVRRGVALPKKNTRARLLASFHLSSILFEDTMVPIIE